VSSIVYPYLGTPGSMQQLPGPSGDIEAATTRGESVKTLLSGATAVVRRLNAKKTFGLPYTGRPGTGLADLLSSFYEGVFGIGPYVFVDPSVQNVLPLDVANCGIRTQAGLGFVASSGTLADGVAGSPITGSSVLTWTAPASGASLQPGSVSLTADKTTAPVYLPGEAVTVSLYAKVSSVGSHTLVLGGYDATGASIATATTSIALTTSFQRFSLSIAAGAGAFASCAFVLPRLLTTAGALTFSVAALQLEYGTAASTWQRGYGSPRVLITSSPGRAGALFQGYSTHTLALSEI
jgi:hypothetical protein